MGRTLKKTTKEKKLIITFDEEARREYLTGFSKRKKLRKKQAKAEELKKELAKRKEKRAKKKSTLKQTMMRYDLLDMESPMHASHDEQDLSFNTTQQYSGTTVTISRIPALEARTTKTNSASNLVEESTDSQIASTKSDKTMSNSSQRLSKLRNKSQKKLRKLKKWNCI